MPLFPNKFAGSCRVWMTKSQRQFWLDNQKKWIAEHGGNLAGYVCRYGSESDPEHYGDGGEAIYAADIGWASLARNKGGIQVTTLDRPDVRPSGRISVRPSHPLRRRT